MSEEPRMEVFVRHDAELDALGYGIRPQAHALLPARQK